VLLAPATVITVTLTLPYLSFPGALHLICMALQKTHLVHLFLPNFTELVPRAAPKPLPLMMTVAPRLLEAGLSFVMLGLAVSNVTVRLAALVAEAPDCPAAATTLSA